MIPPMIPLPILPPHLRFHTVPHSTYSRCRAAQAPEATALGSKVTPDAGKRYLYCSRSVCRLEVREESAMPKSRLVE